MRHDPWHYSRDALAQAYFDQFDTRLTHAAVLFGPRRTGKTEFLLHDLGPLAQAHGWRVAYASLWQSRLSPLAALMHALATAKARGSLAERVERLASATLPKAKISAGPPGARAEVEIDLTALRKTPERDDLLRLDDLFDAFAVKSRRVLLLIDEAQELAAHPDNAGFIAALRTSLDTRKERLAVLFTGSSQDALRGMFARRDAPFFQFAAFVDWPPLEDRFVHHMHATFTRVIGRAPDAKALLDAFHTLDRNPFFFRKLLEIVAFDPARDVAAALNKIRARIAEDLNYDEVWRNLSTLQRALARTIAEEAGSALFAKATLASLGRRIDGAPPTRTQVQAALRALARSAIVRRTDERGGYAFNDPLLAQWVLTRSI